MDQNKINTITAKLNNILGSVKEPDYQENLATLQWIIGNYSALINLDDAQGTASWSKERAHAAREFLITNPLTTNIATKILCRVLGFTIANKLKNNELTTYASALAEWALSPAGNLQEGIALTMSHSQINCQKRWKAFESMMASGFFRLQFILPSMIASSQFFSVQSDIWQTMYGCLPNFRTAFPRIRDIAIPIEKLEAREGNAKRDTIRVGAWSNKFGQYLSSATNVHPWLMNLEEPGLEVYMLSERRSGDPIQQKYRQLYGARFIDCDEKTDDEFVTIVRALDLDVLIMVHPTRTAYAQMQRVARCHLDFFGMYRPLAAPDQTLINIGALDLAFAESTGRNLIVIPEPSFAHTPRPHLELKDRPAGAEFCFGAFNRALKFNSHLLDVWGRILRECPNSSLLISFLQIDYFTEYIVKAEFASRGVGPRRIIIAPRVNHIEHLDRHNTIDIMLDTFPVGAGMTAVDTFDMGVPLLSLSGDYRPCALQAKSLLALLGKEAGLYAENEEAYVAYAKEQYMKGPLTKARRQALRDLTNKSPIYNHERYTHFMRKVLRVAAEGAKDQITYISE